LGSICSAPLFIINQNIQNSYGETLDYSFASGADDSKRLGWIVILGHGVTSNKDRPTVIEPAAALNAAGFDTLRFSFAGNGDSDGDFRDATITKELGDLNAIINAVASTYPKIAYIGHSMGGAVGVIQASSDTRIDALISIAGMIDTKAFAETEFGEVTPDTGCMWDDESCPLSSAYMTDLCQTHIILEAEAKRITAPWLLLHGTADDVVLPNDSETVRRIKGDQVTLVTIKGADHSFNEPAHKAELIETIATWLASQA
jgi:alpha/beta superfamily hydrolase